jgi:hypothetical protein
MNQSGSESVRYLTYQIPNLSDTEPIRYRTYQIPNLSDTEPNRPELPFQPSLELFDDHPRLGSGGKEWSGSNFP